jgi:hypothetical protein
MLADAGFVNVDGHQLPHDIINNVSIARTGQRRETV